MTEPKIEQYTYLSDFEIFYPKHRFNQSDLLKWTSNCHKTAEKLNPKTTYNQDSLITLEKLFDRYAVKENQISQRYLECADASLTDLTKAEVYKVDEHQQTGLDIYGRTLFFSQRADEVFHKAYSQKQIQPDHLIHVTCTGYISPSAAQKIVTSPNWNKSTAVTHAYHMGCYASMPAIRIAQGLVAENRTKSNNYQVDIIHTEMCGLHMNPLAQTPEQTIVQTLFSDGHIKYSASHQPKKDRRHFKVLALHEKIILDSTQDMSWIPTSWGMQMNLSREVPLKIRTELKPFLIELLNLAKMNMSDLSAAEFAIHPGGPKIIDTVKEILELPESKIAHSKKVLLERGNMSSATLPHVWEAMLKDESIKSGQKIISFAFGPGLTVFGCVLEVC